MIDEKLSYLTRGSFIYEGIIKRTFDFINKEQLLDKKLWDEFINVFAKKPDSEDGFWRGEFWGKTMRGACLCYEYENDENLYGMLKYAVLGLLDTQDSDGRISTYKKDKEMFSWDIWCRKYVNTGLIHFYHICHEEDLKNKIVLSLKKHIDYLINNIGKEEGKTEITYTSEWWLGVNSCSILESICAFYRITNEKKYLDFAKYIVETGGIREGNLINIVKEDKLLPYQFPEQKAYETMSFFEGVLDYALITDDEELKNICIKFYDDVAKSDMSITGNAGANEEIFSNASVNQIYKPERIYQETCVTVTWMRTNTKLLLLTGEQKYYDRLEVSSRNAFLGACNFDHQLSYDQWTKKYLAPLPFDSYSPLKNDKRGKATGGICYLENGYYGCCACISSAGVALTALNTVLKGEHEYFINDFYSGNVKDENIDLQIQETLIKDGNVKMIIAADGLNIKIRIPTWSNNPTMKVDGLNVDVNKGEYKTLLIKGRSVIELKLNPILEKTFIKDQVAFTYGPIVLSIDEEVNPDLILEDLKSTEISNIALADSYKSDYQLLFKADFNNKTIYFKDYGFSGKHWNLEKSRLTVWIDK